MLLLFEAIICTIQASWKKLPKHIAKQVIIYLEKL